VPFIQKYKINPVTGRETKLSELINLHMTPSESDKTNFMCPISQKDFTLTTKVVAIKTSGNVYSNDVVEELNKKHDNWHDLITGQPFTAKDIIVL